MAPSAAQSLLAKADKKFRSSPGWFSSSSSKYEEAGDLFQQAANAFKLEKLFKEAGDAHAREAECRELQGEKDEAAAAWWNAGKAYKKGFPEDAVNALSKTITLLTQAGKFRQAADREKEIAQIYLQDSHDLARAVESFERAGDWYAQEDAMATANGCYKEAADLHAELEHYPQAIERYQQVADHSLTSSLTRYSVKEYWLRALLCALAIPDAISAKRDLDAYVSKDITFGSTREAQFVQKLIEAVENDDVDDFTAAVAEFDKVTRLDNWKTAVLLKIKKEMLREPNLT